MQDYWIEARKRKTGIMATLGASSSHPDVIAELYDAGTDLFRLDFSCGSLAAHGERYRTIRMLHAGASRPAAILADLQGTAFRLGLMVGGFVSLRAGQILRLELDPSPGNSRRVPLSHPEFFAQVRSGDELFIDDGQVRLLVMSAAHDHVETIVLAGGYIADAKRVAIPASAWPAGLTDKDRADAIYAAALGVDWLALSAACGAGGLAELRSLVGSRPRLMARIDNSAALARIDETLALADGVMFAHHDLAMSLPREELFRLQEKLFMDCGAADKLMVAATQRLAESAHDSNHRLPTPDSVAGNVATVMRHGAHVLMLSAGSAAGAFPVENVAMLERLIRTAERAILPDGLQDTWRTQTEIQNAAPMQIGTHAHMQEHGKPLPVIEMNKRSGDLCTPDAGHMAEP